MSMMNVSYKLCHSMLLFAYVSRPLKVKLMVLIFINQPYRILTLGYERYSRCRFFCSQLSSWNVLSKKKKKNHLGMYGILTTVLVSLTIFLIGKSSCFNLNQSFLKGNNCAVFAIMEIVVDIVIAS